MRKLGFLIIVSFVLLSVYSFTNNHSESHINRVNWLTWEEAMELSEVEQKKILVSVYTKWCGWCKKMEKTTYSNGTDP